MKLTLNNLFEQSEKKLEELDKYISNPNNDHMSEDAETLRAEIYLLQSKIDLLLKGMIAKRILDDSFPNEIEGE